MVKPEQDHKNPAEHHHDHLECVIVNVAGLSAKGAVTTDNDHPDQQTHYVSRTQQGLEHDAHSSPLRDHIGKNADQNDRGAEGANVFVLIQGLKQIRHRQRAMFFTQITHRFGQQSKDHDIGQNSVNRRQTEQWLVTQIVAEARQADKEEAAGDGSASGEGDKNRSHLPAGNNEVRHVFLRSGGHITEPQHNREISHENTDNYRMSHSSSRPSLYKNP